MEHEVIFLGSEREGQWLSDLLQGKFTLRCFKDIHSLSDREFNSGKIFLFIATTVETLAHLKERCPSVQRFWLSVTEDVETLEKLINSKIATKVISQNDSASEVVDLIKRAAIHYAEQLAAKVILQDVGKQNRELEVLNRDLESLVEERTFHIKVSETDDKEKINRIRALIRFIKNLSSLDSFEDILASFRSEIRRFHGLGDPMLYFKNGENDFQLVYFRGGSSHYVKVSQALPIVDRIEPVHSELSFILANILSRPMGKILSFPLGEEGAKNSDFFLLIEHQLENVEQGLFLEYIHERRQTLRLALERVMFEQKLSSSIYRWERTFDGIKDPIGIIDADYNLLRANKNFNEKIHNGKCFTSWCGGQETCEGCPAQKALISGEPQTGQVKKQGRFYLVTAYPIRLGPGERVSNIVNHYIDMTESQELYSRMIQNEKIGALGLLAGNIAHELNNPLTGIRSLSQALVLEMQSQPAMASDLQEIEKGARRSQEIIKNLLDFSQGQAEIQDLNLNELVQKTLPMLKTALRNHRSEVVLSGGAEAIRVHGHLIQQVIFNLVNNACQSMPQQGTLTLTTEDLALNGRRGIRLAVRDTGVGISDEIKDRIFEPFFTTKKDGFGTGLGLSIAKSVIESFNGRIGVESKVGLGSVFWIWLPIVTSEQKELF